MNYKSVLCYVRFITVALVLLCPALTLAQTPAIASRITQAVDESRLTTLRGNTHPLANPRFDRGPAPPSMPMERMLLVLKRSPEQETALDVLLDQQQDNSSPNYHQWLSPDQFGQQFGPSDQDVQAITSWLRSHGFQVAQVSRGRTSIEFSGTATQVQEAFHTAIHRYNVNGEDHWANSSDPQIPSALATVIAGVNTLHNFPREAMHHVAGLASRSKSTGKVTLAQPSLYSLGGECGVPGVGCNAVGPFDFATIYNLLPLWNATPTHVDGTGQTIAIVGESDINPQDVAAFRTYFGLPSPNLQIIVDGPDPGFVQGDETESDLDVEWAGATAPGAMIDFVTSQSTEASLGVDLSAQYIVDNNLAPVLSESYGICELFLGTAGNQFYNQLWQQAAAQGITVLVATGDSGSAVCDRNAGTEGAAQYGLSVSGISSTPYNVAVGGTDFSDLTNPSTYWAATNSIPPVPGNQTAIPTVSALSYIPETTWNDSCTNSVFGTLLGFSGSAETNCNNSQIIGEGFVTAVGGSGGRSACTNSDGQTISTCTGGYAKPSWQTGNGVPSDGKRDLPDVSLFAAINSPSGSFYVVCEADFNPDGSSCVPTNPNTNFLGVGGTSASTPALAGILALVNQQTQTRQGNANYTLYKLAAQQPTAFHDVLAGGTIAMPCATGSTSDCITSSPGDRTGVLSGYSTTTGYDLATGLGSVNANNLVTKWTTVTAGSKGTATSLTISPVTSPSPHGTAVPLSITVAPSPSSSGTPTGQVSLITSTGESAGSFTLGTGGSIAPGTTANLLPGGNYMVTAHYAGDGTFAPSDSSPIAVTVAPEASKVQIAYELFNPTTGQQTNPNASTAAFNTPALLRINVTSNAGDVCPQNAPGESGCPAGNVTVTDNGNPLDAGSYQLNSLGYTEDQTIFLTGGIHTIVATYPVSDGSYSAPSSTTDVITIQKAATSIALGPGTLNIGGDQGGELSAAISTNISLTNPALVPAGYTQFYFDGSPFQTPVATVGSINPQTGIAKAIAEIAISPSAISAGSHLFTAQYLGDSNYAESALSGSVTVIVQASPIITMTSSNLNPLAGIPVIFTTLVTAPQLGGPAPTGSLSFDAISPQGNVLAVGTISNGQAQASLILPKGTVSVYAIYTGDSNYAEVTGPTIIETVTAIGTTMTMTSSNPSPQVGTNVTFTATITSSQGGGPAITGIVGFRTTTGVPLGNSGISSGQAQVTASALPVGSNTVVATYSPDNYHAGSIASVSETVSVGSTTITVGSSSPTITQISSVTFTAQINPANPGAPTPTGTVQFTVNGSSIGSSTISNGKAQISTSALPIGSIPIVAIYSGDANYTGSSGMFSQAVIAAGTTTTVTSSTSTIAQGSSVTFTAHVNPTTSGGPMTAGSVQFTANASLIGTVAVSNGQAQITISSLPQGSVQIQATYLGDSDYTSSSGSTTETVTPPPTFTVTANPTAISVSAPGQAGSTVLTFTSQNGLTGTNMTVAAACTGLPSEATCSFSPTATVTSTTVTLPANGSTTATFYVLTTAPSSATPAANNGPGGFGRWTVRKITVPACAVCIAMLLLGFRRKQFRSSTALAMLAFAFIIATAACGGGGESSSGGGGSGGGGGNPANPGTPLTQNAPINVSLTLSGVTQAVPNLTVTVQ